MNLEGTHSFISSESVNEISDKPFIKVDLSDVIQKLNVLGVNSEVINKYKDSEGLIDILTVAFKEGYADYCSGGKLFAYRKDVDFIIGGNEITMALDGEDLVLDQWVNGGGSFHYKFSKSEVETLKAMLDRISDSEK